jgi:tetratricopeptide (TPR) repeat protein
MPPRKRTPSQPHEDRTVQSTRSWTLDRLAQRTQAPRAERATASPPSFEDVLAVSDEIAALSRGDPSRALRLAESLVEIARSGSAASLAAARRCRGHMFRRLGRHREAIRDYTRALESFERLGMRLESARTAIGIVGALGYLGRVRDAVQLAARFRPVFLRHGERGRAARLDVNVGFLSEQSGRPQDALRAYRRAASIFERQAATADLALVQFNQANALVSLDRYEEGLSLYRSSAETWKSLGATATVCRCQLAIGSVLLRLGRLGEALRLLEETSEQASSLGDPVVTATAALDLARAELLVGRVNGVSSRLDIAISGFQALAIHPDLAESYCLQGSLHGRMGRWEEAVAGWQRAADLYRGIRHARGAAWADFSQADALRHLGRYDESRRLLQVALRGLRRHGPALSEMEARLVLAEQDVEVHPARARRHLAAVSLRLRSIRDPWVEYGYWIVRTRLERRVRSRGRALSALERAYRILRDLRSQAPLESLQAEWVGRRDELFRLALDVPWTQRADRRPIEGSEARWMFRWSERARVARTPFVGDGGANSDEHEGDPNLEAFERAREELHWLDTQERSRRIGPAGSGQTGTKRLDAWRRKRARAMTRVERYGRRLELRASRQDPHRAQDPDPAVIQDSLIADECLMEFFVGDGGVFTFVVTREAVEVLPPVPVDEIRDAVVRLRQVWDRYRLGSGFVRRHEASLASTTTNLLATVRSHLLDPVRSILPGRIRQLVISPHAWLRGVPFHAMLEDPWEVRYALSGQSLVSESGSRPDNQGHVLIVGVASEDAPAAEREALAVARMYPGCAVLLGKDATRHAVREQWVQADVIHVAAHGSIQVEDPRLSGIHLSDGTWTVHDLRTVTTRAKLAVLSSCRSGETVLWGADHQVGLLPALFEHGPRTAVLSLWPADDETTRILMSAFHHEVSQRRSVGEALRSARRVVREVKPDPYYWAPFVQYGAEPRGGLVS